jgi:hypothetical protein
VRVSGIVVPWFEEPFHEGDDSPPEEPDGEEAAEQPADEKLDDVAARAGIQVAKGRPEQNWRSERCQDEE